MFWNCAFVIPTLTALLAHCQRSAVPVFHGLLDSDCTGRRVSVSVQRLYTNLDANGKGLLTLFARQVNNVALKCKESFGSTLSQHCLGLSIYLIAIAVTECSGWHNHMQCHSHYVGYCTSLNWEMPSCLIASDFPGFFVISDSLLSPFAKLSFAAFYTPSPGLLWHPLYSLSSFSLDPRIITLHPRSHFYPLVFRLVLSPVYCWAIKAPSEKPSSSWNLGRGTRLLSWARDNSH